MPAANSVNAERRLQIAALIEPGLQTSPDALQSWILGAHEMTRSRGEITAAGSDCDQLADFVHRFGGQSRYASERIRRKSHQRAESQRVAVTPTVRRRRDAVGASRATP